MKQGQTSGIVRTLCGLLFCIFTLSYLYFFQSDVLSYTQHIYSGGLTHYSPWWGAVLITLGLLSLTILMRRFLFRNLYFLPSFSYIPALMLLAVISDDHLSDGNHSQVVGGNALYWAVVIVSLMAVVNLLLRNVNFLGQIRSSLDLLRGTVANTAVLLVVFLVTVLLSNSNVADHTELRIETLIAKHDWDEILRLQKHHDIISPHLTMSRALALSHTGQLGEKFFEHRVCSSSDCLLPCSGGCFLNGSALEVGRATGGIPGRVIDTDGNVRDMRMIECLECLDARNRLRSQDYLLTAYLIDCRLKDFTDLLLNTTDSLNGIPKHYREALVLYRHKGGKLPEFSFPETEADYADFHEQMKKNPDGILRENTVRDGFGNTYWYYFFFISRQKKDL